MPKISVIIPTYNSVRYIGEAIKSVLIQTFKDYEIIVIDDASTDGTAELLSRFAGAVQYVRNENNKGCAFSKNVGVDLARGEYIAVLDSDDVWLPRNLELKINFLERQKTAPVVCSDFEIFGDCYCESSFKKRKIFSERTKGEAFIVEDTLALLIQQCYMFTSTTLLRTDVVRGFGNFINSGSDDYDLFLRISREANLGCINEVLVKKRDHEGNLSKNRDTNFLTRTEALKRVLLSPGLGKRHKGIVLRRLSENAFDFGCWQLRQKNANGALEKFSTSLQYNFSFKVLLYKIKTYLLNDFKR